MAVYRKGDIVVVRFPFTDQTGMKKRPALVIFKPEGDNVILAQITGQDRGHYAITIEQDDVSKGRLDETSYVQPDIIITLHQDLILGRIAILKPDKLKEIADKIIEFLT
jgi:mRNA interferase MazF